MTARFRSRKSNPSRSLVRTQTRCKFLAAAVHRSRRIMSSRRLRESRIAQAKISKWITRPGALSTRICLLLPPKLYPPLTDASDLASACSTGPNVLATAVYSETTTRVQHGWFHTSVPNADQESFSMRLEGFFTPKESGMHTLSLSAVGWGKLYLE